MRVRTLVLLAALACSMTLARAEGGEPVPDAELQDALPGQPGTLFGRLLEAGVECPQFELSADAAAALAASEPSDQPTTAPDAGPASDPETDPGTDPGTDPADLPPRPGDRISLTGEAPKDLGPYQLDGRWSRFSYCMQGRSFDVRKFTPLLKP